MEDIKILKVELNKLESLYKKFKESYNISNNNNAFMNVPTNNGSLLSSLASGGEVMETELVLIEIARIKN